MRVEGARHAGAAVDVVDDEDEALRAEGRELAHDDGLGGRVKRGERLVEEQDRRAALAEEDLAHELDLGVDAAAPTETEKQKRIFFGGSNSSGVQNL